MAVPGATSRCCARGVLTLLAVAAVGVNAQTAPAAIPVLTTVAQIRSLSHDEANRNYPVHVTAVVTYDHPISTDLFVQDNTGGIYVNTTGARPAMRAGDLLDIEGVTEAPDFAPQIGKAHMRLIGTHPLPKPAHPGFGELISSREDSQWVELEAIVRNTSITGGLLTLDLSVGGGELRGYVVDPGPLT